MTIDNFMINDKVAIITGGAGLLGQKHAEAVVDGQGIAILLDISNDKLEEAVKAIKDRCGSSARVEGIVTNITRRDSIESARDYLLNKYHHIDILINNAANNPKMESQNKNMGAIQFENLPIDIWQDDIAVGLTGAFQCAQVFGGVMAKQERGVILNISSDLGIIAPDQRIYRKDGLAENEQTVKPVTYSVIKHGLLGLTKYLATYYAEKGVRTNALCPGGVYNGQDDVFMGKLTNLIPLGRMANVEEYKSTILYLISDASSYMTGSTVIVDGGRTCW